MSVNGLNKITDKILEDARAEAARILAEAEAECCEIKAKYEAEADAIRERLSVAAEQKGADMIARARSSAAMEKRNILLQQRSDLIEGVFKGAEEWVLSLPQDKYSELLAGLAASALLELSGTEAENREMYGDEEESLPVECQLLFNKKDKETCAEQVLALLKKKVKGKIPDERVEALTVSHNSLPISGGVVLRCGDVEFNCSFELVFAGLQRELEADVNRALFEARGKRA